MSPLEVPVEEAAALVHVQPATIRRRLRAGELKGTRAGGRDVVVLDPSSTWLRVEDAGVLLDLTPASVRAEIRRGALAGRRERGGRWRVRLESVLVDRRCDPDVVARFGGEPAPPAPAPPSGPAAHRLRRDVFLRLDEADVALLERARDRHGTIQAAIVAGLRAGDDDGASPSEAAELRSDRDLYRDEAAQATERAQLLAELARERLVDELYCPRCERLVPIEEAGRAADEDGVVVLYHAEHGKPRRRSRVRASTIMGRRRPLEQAP